MSTQTIRPLHQDTTSPSWTAGAWHVLRLLLDRLLVWDARSRSRRQLMSLDPHLRRDIGLERAEIDRELRKFFWQP